MSYVACVVICMSASQISPFNKQKKPQTYACPSNVWLAD